MTKTLLQGTIQVHFMTAGSFPHGQSQHPPHQVFLLTDYAETLWLIQFPSQMRVPHYPDYLSNHAKNLGERIDPLLLSLVMVRLLSAVSK